MKYNIRNDFIRWRISTSIEVIARIFTLAFTVLEIKTFQMFDLENLGSQCSHSMAKVNVYKSHNWAFSLAIAVFQILLFQIVWPWKSRLRSRCTKFAMAPFDAKYLTAYLMRIVILVLSFIIYEIFAKQIKCQKVDHKRSRSRRKKTELAPFDWNYSILCDFSEF